MRHFFATLLLVIPFTMPLLPAIAGSPRTIDITLTRFAFSPEVIELRVGERVQLNVVSTDGTHGFHVKELGLNARIPAGGKPVTLDLTPTEAGTFELKCSEYCGSGHGRMKARIVVTPDK